ncbi:DUF3995 domain-containing protein [Paenibacillus puerhi]|uniref:DUF3995 domain-containing protein n=1 Tax=Paenibacillus puerhi TaxID=2692622 RepID=UPI0022A68904|nr:DUF3995 domain-containing protein [Paenibacillus puerhi]
MTILLALSVVLLLGIAGVHVYWAFGGAWGAQAVLPSRPNEQPVFQPGIAVTLLVALLLFGAGLLLAVQGGFLPSIPAYRDRAARLLGMRRGVRSAQHRGFPICRNVQAGARLALCTA